MQPQAPHEATYNGTSLTVETTLSVLPPPEDEVICLQSAGRAHYLEGNYTVAISAFTKALKLPNVPTIVQIGILHNRAAAWEKIGGTGNLELALLDMRLMMTQLSNVQAEGYLFAGKILQLLDKDKSALDMYEEGIKRVKPDVENFEVRGYPFKQYGGK